MVLQVRTVLLENDKVLYSTNSTTHNISLPLLHTDITPWTIDTTGRRLRKEMAKTDPEGAAVLTHTEVRLLAIRDEMERITLERKLKGTAEDWATDVESLTEIVVKSAQQYVLILNVVKRV